MARPTCNVASWGLASLGVALCLSTPALGQTLTDTFGPFSVDSPGAGQLSSGIYNHSVTTGAGPIEAEYTASPGHCSNVIMHFLLDGTEEAVSGVLAAGASTGFVSLGTVAEGNHVVGLQAEGVVSGCNTGDLANWGGTGAVRYQGRPFFAIPTLSPWAMAMLFAVLLTSALLVLRRRRPA
jgi:hypothetical protein